MVTIAITCAGVRAATMTSPETNAKATRNVLTSSDIRVVIGTTVEPGTASVSALVTAAVAACDVSTPIQLTGHRERCAAGRRG